MISNNLTIVEHFKKKPGLGRLHLILKVEKKGKYLLSDLRVSGPYKRMNSCER